MHRHLCPRQVLGVRMGMWAGEILELKLPQYQKRLLTVVETDGCFADGVSVATNCWVGRRTMRVEDYGKVAATFVDTQIGSAVRISPHPQARHVAHDYAGEAHNRWQSMLLGYQYMPYDELFVSQQVELVQPASEIISRPGSRVNCACCGEEIINQREILDKGQPYCIPCSRGGYYAAGALIPRFLPAIQSALNNSNGH